MNDKKKVTAAVLTAMVCVAGIVQAQSAAPVPEILARALSLEGRWQAKAKLTMEGKSRSFTYSMSYRKTADGNGLQMEESADVPDVGTLRGTNLIGFDPHAGKLHWFSVDNFGTTHDHLGQLVTKDHLRLAHQSQREGKAFREEIDFIWRGADKVEVKLVATLDGAVHEVLEGTFTRVPKVP